MSETKRYIISDASKAVHVEPHVLRYWEEELALNIPRNEMGHRYYRQEDINALLTIKELKEQGFQLRAIKMLIPDLDSIHTMDNSSILKLKNEIHNKLEDSSMIVTTKENSVSLETPASTDKMEQFKQILQKIVLNAMQENNQNISQDITARVTENINKEMDFLFRDREERDEERFRALDETIRSFQKSRLEAAAASAVTEKKGLFRRKVKK